MKVQVEAQNTGAWVRHVDFPAPVGASTSLCEAFILSCILERGVHMPTSKSRHVPVCWQTTHDECASRADPEKIARWILPPTTASVVWRPGDK